MLLMLFGRRINKGYTAIWFIVFCRNKMPPPTAVSNDAGVTSMQHRIEMGSIYYVCYTLRISAGIQHRYIVYKRERESIEPIWKGEQWERNIASLYKTNCPLLIWIKRVLHIFLVFWGLFYLFQPNHVRFWRHFGMTFISMRQIYRESPSYIYNIVNRFISPCWLIHPQ